MATNKYDLANKIIDLVDPAIKPFMKGIGSFFNIMFFPFNLLSAKIYKSMDNFANNVAQEFNKIPQNNLVEPPLNKIGPILEASKFYVENEVLSSMFAKLLVSSCNIDKQKYSHVAFVEVIKQLTPDEAQILKELSNNESFPCVDFNIKSDNSIDGYKSIISNFIPTNFYENGNLPFETYMSFIDNLIRLSIIYYDKTVHFTDNNLYKIVEQTNIFLKYKSKYGDNFIYQKYIARLTNFGKLFIEAVLQ